MKYSFQNILNDHLADFRHLPSHKRTALYNISTCRTERRGTFEYECDSCDKKLMHYQSCGSRYCPKCSSYKSKQWLADREEEILPTSYLFITLTLPQRIQEIFLCNQEICYKSFFTVSAEVIKNAFNTFVEPGGEAGGMSFLHTWKQNVEYFTHIHTLMPAGCLSEDRKEWVGLSPKFSLPYKALRNQFMHKMVDCLLLHYKKLRLELPASLDEFPSLRAFKNYLYGKVEWNVKVQRTQSHPQYAFNYLARYVNRTAISEERIECYDGKSISIRVKNRETNSFESSIIPIQTFLNNFIKHILPKGFTRVRYFGFLSCSKKKDSLAHIFELFDSYTPNLTPEQIKSSFARELKKVQEKNTIPCPECKTGTMLLFGIHPPQIQDTPHPLYHLHTE